MKYVDTLIAFSEIPKEVALCINISGCRIHCKGCHSKYLWEDIGTPLTPKTLDDLILCSKGITCVCIMGGHNYKKIADLMKRIKVVYHLKTAWYTGEKLINPFIMQNIRYFDYIKTGPYMEDKEPLNSPTTNQHFYHIVNCKLNDRTYWFWK